MRYIIFLLLCIPQPALAQRRNAPIVPSDDVHLKPRPAVRYGIAMMPTKAHRINGLAIGVWPQNMEHEEVRITGLNADLLPLGAFMGAYMVLMQPALLLSKPDSAALANDPLPADEHYYGAAKTTVTGMDLRLAGGIPVDVMKGVSINGVVSFCGDQRGEQ